MRTRHRLRDSAARLERWDRVDRGANVLLVLAMVVAVVCGVLGFAGIFTGCTPQGEQPGMQWPPEVAFENAELHGYLDLEIVNEDGKRTIQRFALDTKTEDGELGVGDVRVVAWGVNGQLDAKVNGRTQAVFVESTNSYQNDDWVHCFNGGLALEWADEGTVRATGIPPGFSPECGEPGVSINVPFLGWDVSFSRGVPGPDPADRPGEGAPAYTGGGDPEEPVRHQ